MVQLIMEEKRKEKKSYVYYNSILRVVIRVLRDLKVQYARPSVKNTQNVPTIAAKCAILSFLCFTSFTFTSCPKKIRIF